MSCRIYMNKITISVVIPTYNRSEWVCDAIDSVLAQTKLEYICEIIVVDDGSTDNTRDILNAKYSSNGLVKYIFKKNGGVSSARNLGMNLSKGNWIALLDSDDEWLPNKIEEQVKILKANEEIDFLGTNADNEELNILFRKVKHLYKASVYDLCIKAFPVTPSMLFKKEVYQETHGFNEKKKYYEDAEFCLEVCQKFNFYHLPVSLVRTGHGKVFGEAGLSSNVKEMHLGRTDSIKKLKNSKVISLPFYIFLRIFNYLRYKRRCIMVKKVHED